jgi:hypothetical protein
VWLQPEGVKGQTRSTAGETTVSDSNASQIYVFYVIGEDVQGREVVRQPLADLREFVGTEGGPSNHPTHWFSLLVVGWDSEGEIWGFMNKGGIWCPLK